MEGGWNWQFLPPLYIGWIGGAIVTLIAAVVVCVALRSALARLVGILFCAPTLAFAISSIVYFFALLPERRANESCQDLLEIAERDPSVVHEFIAKAKNRGVTQSEKMVIWQTVWKRGRIPSEDVPYLLEYFREDISAVAGLLKNQEVAESDLRMVYERYKNQSGGIHRINDELISMPDTPVDILYDIAHHNDRYPSSPTYPEHLVRRAEQEIEKRNEVEPADASNHSPRVMPAADAPVPPRSDGR